MNVNILLNMPFWVLIFPKMHFMLFSGVSFPTSLILFLLFTFDNPGDTGCDRTIFIRGISKEYSSSPNYAPLVSSDVLARHFEILRLLH